MESPAHPDLLAHARDVIGRCHRLAEHTEEPGWITRTFLSKPMHAVHSDVREWMLAGGLGVCVDAAGNIRGRSQSPHEGAPKLLIGSHLDTVPHAGAFDGILGVMLGIKLAELSSPQRVAIEVIGFSEEEGVRFGVPFIGSRAFVGETDSALLAREDRDGISVAEAIREFGLNPDEIAAARAGDYAAYLELHIEQGPVLEKLDVPLGVVEGIVGQSRLTLTFTGHANHAGTTPMPLRRDALAGAAEWIVAVERETLGMPGLVATVGQVHAEPGAGNVIAGAASVTLDVRHPSDAVRQAAVELLLGCASEIAKRRGLFVASQVRLEQAAVAMGSQLTKSLEDAVKMSGFPVHRMHSGAGHDAMVLAPHIPSTMLFLRSPGGISHHPDESVCVEDVAAALAVGLRFLQEWERSFAI